MSKFVKKLSQYLPQYSDFFGLKIFADSPVPKHKLEHTTEVLYQYLDNDEDGKVDNAKVLKALVKRNGGMIINNTPQSEEINEPKYRRITENMILTIVDFTQMRSGLRAQDFDRALINLMQHWRRSRIW